MKAFSLLSLLLCLVTLIQAQEVLTNGGFDGCPAFGSIPGWTDGYGTESSSSYTSMFTNPPAGDTCYGLLVSYSPVVQRFSQSVAITNAGKYDFTGLVGCFSFSVAGTCTYSLFIDGIPVALTPNTPDPSPGNTGNDFILIKALGIDLTATTHTLQFRYSPSVSSQFAFISYLSLKPAAASGSADPHIVGFNGQRFDYIGRPGQVVNMLSDPALQVNAKLGMQRESETMYVDGPVMMEMAFMTRSHTISINSGGYLKEEIGFVKVDGVLLPLGQSLSFPDDKISVSFSALSVLAKDLGLVGDQDHIVAQVEIKLEGLFEFTVFMIQNHHSPFFPEIESTSKYYRRFLDFNASLLDQDRRPHGILGQTAAPLSKERSVGEWKIEGTDQDYVVKDGLTGTQFLFNQF